MISGVDTRELLRMQAEDNQVFETIIQRIYSGILRHGDNCIDGGAHNGLHTFPLARLVAPDGMVLAFEPVPSVATALEAALASQGIRNVRVFRHALYHEHRLVQFKIVKNATTRSGIERTSYPFVPDIDAIEVTTALIDELDEIDSLRFCKLDLEGGEFRALQGARSSLERYGPVLIFERSVGAPSWYGYTPEHFIEFFGAVRYKVFDLFGQPLTLSNWGDPLRPWYAIAVCSTSDDEECLREALPVILGDLLDRERSPTTDSTNHPIADGPIIWAAPNPVAAGTDEGTTVVHWDTGDASMGEVYISVNGAEERLFFRGTNGARAAPWINAWGIYEFRLYRAPERSELLATVTVTRRKR